MVNSDEILQRQRELSEKRDHLLNQLERSLGVERFLPGIFDHGNIRVRWEGSASGGHMSWTGIVTDGNGDEHFLPPEAFDVLNPPLPTYPELRDGYWGAE